MKTIIAAASRENTMQPVPSPLRLSLMNLNPIAKIATVTAASEIDMPTIAIQYNILKNSATAKFPPFVTFKSHYSP